MPGVMLAVYTRKANPDTIYGTLSIKRITGLPFTSDVVEKNVEVKFIFTLVT